MIKKVVTYERTNKDGSVTKMSAVRWVLTEEEKTARLFEQLRKRQSLRDEQEDVERILGLLDIENDRVMDALTEYLDVMKF